jgi:hypothetical protein
MGPDGPDERKAIMTKNEATWDRAIRIVLGVGLLSLVFLGPKTPWGLIGVVPLLTGLLGHCPLYRVVGLSTCPVTTKG